MQAISIHHHPVSNLVPVHGGSIAWQMAALVTGREGDYSPADCEPLRGPVSQSLEIIVEIVKSPCFSDAIMPHKDF